MNLFETVILIGLIGNTILGFFVLLSNPRRAVNISFFSLTMLMMIWLGSMFFATLQQHSSGILLFWVRQTSAFAGLIPIGVFTLQLAITNPDITVLRLLAKLRYWLFACLLMVIVCHSPIFILSSEAATATQTVPVSKYGIGFIPYLVFFTSVSIAMIVGLWTSSRKLSGVQKTESQFLQLGCWLSFSSGIFLYGASVLFDIQEVSRFVPLSVLILDGFVAYGIATRRILAVPAVLQRVVAYVLMAVYLSALYVLIEWLGGVLFLWLVDDTTYLSHLLAALVVAFSVTPAHSWMQTVSHRLFASANMLNVNVVLEQAAHMFQEVSTEDNLMENFSELIATSFGTTSVLLMRPDSRGGYGQSYPVVSSGDPVVLQASDPILQLLNQDHEAFTIDTLQRMRPRPVVAEALAGRAKLSRRLTIVSIRLTS